MVETDGPLPRPLGLAVIHLLASFLQKRKDFPPGIGDMDIRDTLFILLLCLPDRILLNHKEEWNPIISNCMNGHQSTLW